MLSVLLLAVAGSLELVRCVPLPPPSPGQHVAELKHAPEASVQGSPDVHLLLTPDRTRREAFLSGFRSRPKVGALAASGLNLSIVNPLDVLKRRVMLEMLRRRMRKNQKQIDKNADILARKGKRSTRAQLLLYSRLSANDRRSEDSRRQQTLS